MSLSPARGGTRSRSRRIPRRITARLCGAHIFGVGGASSLRYALHQARRGGFCTEFGGVRYDSKRYTRFGSFLYSDNLRELSRSDVDVLKEYGVTAVVDMRDSGGEIAGIPVLRFSDASDALNFAAKEKGCVLFLGSAGVAVCAYLFRLAGCSREETVKSSASGGSYFCTENIPPDTLRALRAKLI